MPPSLPNATEDHPVLRVIADRIEYLHSDIGEMKTAIKDLASAIIKLALVEERQSQAAVQIERAYVLMEKLESRIVMLEICLPTQKQTATWVHNAIWSGAAVLILVLLKQVGLM